MRTWASALLVARGGAPRRTTATRFQALIAKSA